MDDQPDPYEDITDRDDQKEEHFLSKHYVPKKVIATLCTF